MRPFSLKAGAATVASLLLLGGVMTAGCGGGGGDDNNNPPVRNVQTRQAAVAAVKDSRSKISSRISQALGSLSFGGSSAGSRVKHITRGTRQVSQTPEFDPDSGLYTLFVVEGETAFRILYSFDAAGQQPAGEVTLGIGANGAYNIVFNVPNGNNPITGSMTFTPDQTTDPEVFTGTIVADLRNPENQAERTQINMRINADESVNGSLSFTDADGTLALNNMVYGSNGRLEADLALTDAEGTLTGKIIQNADESGELRINDEGGVYRCVYDASGAGYIIYPDGSREDITDFDTVA